MTQNEILAAAAVMILLAYKYGLSKGIATSSAAVMNDPLAWLNGFQSV